MYSLHFTIGFAGLGMIGGSIARTIRRVHPDCTLYAYDVDQTSIQAALADGTLNKTFDQLDENFANCDIIFLCAPVDINIENLKILKSIIPANCLITDVGSVKNPMQKAVKELDMESQFIGGHPMVGSEKTGYINSNDRLLENAYYFVTPSSNTMFQHIATMSSFVQSLGTLAVTLRPEEHDFITASISHVPHLIAAELVQIVRRADTKNGMLKQLAAGGFKDITRIASSSPIMWEQICMNNSENIKNILKNIVEDIQDMIHHMDQGDGQFINNYFEEAGSYRNSVPDHSVGLFEKIHKIFVDIPDEPGTIANVTSQLAFNSINIKNLGIVNNREFEEGALEILFYDEESCSRAAEVLERRNYTVHIR
ncbi:MAG: prephenate dehydrogenase [Eubacteriales bacterium]|nr:prephenate dehydrogenase [Eubacteriales bacterium]